MKPATLLVVDDDDDLRRSLSAILEEEGYRVVEAANGVLALTELGRSKPDLVLLDMMMPNGDGWTVLHAIQKGWTHSEVPVVIISAYAETLPAGACGLLRKPIRREELLAAIETQLRSH
jgi:DNA-binding response OmpR family regulator